MNKESNYMKHARREFLAIGYIPPEQDDEDGPNKWIQENILALLEVFSTQGHSGSSAPYCATIFKKLALFEPLGPLTGVDDEWRDCGEGLHQNVRCSHVFKRDGQAYDGNGKIFREPDGGCYTNSDSNVNISFPYTPQCEYVDRKKDDV